MAQWVLNNKAGMATQQVASILSACEVGDKIPTVATLTQHCETARGNIQQALAALKESGAVSLEAHGQNGTIITAIDYLHLARICGVKNLVGSMPLPYTKRYEGIATGLYMLLNQDGMRNLISFMRGSEARLQQLLEGSTSYCVMSRLAYQEYRKRNMAIKEVLALGNETYVNRHVLLTHPDFNGDWQNCRVGIDGSSVDQCSLTQRFFANKPVQFVDVQYTQLLTLLMAGKLDAGIWNEDDINLHAGEIAKRALLLEDGADQNATCASIVVRQDDTLTPRILEHYLNKDQLLEIQKQVMTGELIARY